VFPIGTAGTAGTAPNDSEDPTGLSDPVGVGVKGVTRRAGIDRGGFWDFGFAVG
jgi:hypothetical protein